MKKYRIRIVTMESGDILYYPEQRNIGTFLERHLESWYHVPVLSKRKHGYSRCTTEKDALYCIDEYKKLLQATNIIKESIKQVD